MYSSESSISDDGNDVQNNHHYYCNTLTSSTTDNQLLILQHHLQRQPTTTTVSQEHNSIMNYNNEDHHTDDDDPFLRMLASDDTNDDDDDHDDHHNYYDNLMEQHHIQEDIIYDAETIQNTNFIDLQDIVDSQTNLHQFQSHLEEQDSSYTMSNLSNNSMRSSSSTEPESPDLSNSFPYSTSFSSSNKIHTALGGLERESIEGQLPSVSVLTTPASTHNTTAQSTTQNSPQSSTTHSLNNIDPHFSVLYPPVAALAAVAAAAALNATTAQQARTTNPSMPLGTALSGIPDTRTSNTATSTHVMDAFSSLPLEQQIFSQLALNAAAAAAATFPTALPTTSNNPLSPKHPTLMLAPPRPSLTTNALSMLHQHPFSSNALKSSADNNNNNSYANFTSSFSNRGMGIGNPLRKKFLLPKPIYHYNLNEEDQENSDPQSNMYETPAHRNNEIKHHYVHYDKDRRYSCDECGKSFARYYNLKSHIRIHENNKPYVCPHCQLRFARNHDLNRHLKTHSRDRPHMCRDCGKTFSRRDALRRHERMNEDGKKIHCIPMKIIHDATSSTVAAVNALSVAAAAHHHQQQPYHHQIIPTTTAAVTVNLPPFSAGFNSIGFPFT